MSIKTDLQTFYNHEAKKYYESRKKHRNEGHSLLQTIETFQKKPLNILEFGCGSGRFASYLKQHYTGKYTYVGVDISQELLSYAKIHLPKQKFTCEDISEFVVRQKQEKFDLIIGTSSFQHISTCRERLFLMKHFYRLLKYDGIVMMTNWSFSKRFLKKHWKEILKALMKYGITLGKSSRKDVLVPRTNQGKTFHRYYHLFSLKELKKLMKFSGLTIEKLVYLDSKGEESEDWKSSKSSFLVARKCPIIVE
jgi:ubiquinone/menaquinone biosynthesis C-methylase UbiE